MKGIVFRDKDGQMLALGWNADPKNYPPSEHFPEGWTWEEVTEEEGIKLMPQNSMAPKKFPDPPEQVVRELKRSHEALIETLEDHLKLNKGDLKARIATKLKEVE